MKVGILLGLFLLFHVKGLTTATAANCEDNGFNGNWTCVKNNDDTINVTLDCTTIGHKSLEVKFHSQNFPMKMSHLIIQNCEFLVLDSCRPLNLESIFDPPNDTSKANFTHFHVANITNLHLSRSKIPVLKNLPDPLPYYELSEEEVSHYLKEDNTKEGSAVFDPRRFGADSLISITIENIDKLHFEENTHFECDCLDNEGLEEFNLINLSFESAKFFLGNRKPKQKFEFLMNNVTISAKSDGIPIIIWDDKAVVTVINSDFSLMDMVMTGAVSEVVLTRNKFKVLGQTAIVLIAKEFTLSGNFIEKMESCAIQGEFQTAQISNNIIHQIVSGAMDVRPQHYKYQLHSNYFFIISPSQYSSAAKQNLSSQLNYTYNFSNNEIHILEEKALTLPKPHGNITFTDVRIFNNSINCSCQNKGWFNYLAEAKENGKEFYDKWTGGIYLNKCLDVRNCALGQVLNNLENLCEENFKCPKNV